MDKHARDQENVKAFQQGDSEALQRLLDEYGPNIRLATKPFLRDDHRDADTRQEAVTVFMEYVARATPEQARLLARDVLNVVSHGLAEVNEYGAGKSTVYKIWAAEKLLEASAGSWSEGSGMSLPSAAESVDLPTSSLVNALGIRDSSSLDLILDADLDVGDNDTSALAWQVSASPEPECKSTSTDVGSINLDVLTVKQREAVEGFLDYPELNQRDIALFLGLPQKTFQERLQRAFEKLASQNPLKRGPVVTEEEIFNTKGKVNV